MPMSVVGFVPLKLNSERLPRKNVKLLHGRPLLNYAISTLAKCELDDCVVYASSDEVMKYVEPEQPCRFVERPDWLDTDAAKVQDFVGAFLTNVPCDVVVLLHVTSPFISQQTVRTCIEAVTSGRHESAFAALEIRRFAWFRDQPLNFQINQPTPRTQDLEPVLVEQSGFYVFTRDLFQRTRQRISDNPYIHIVDPIEGHDIDTQDEFTLAEALLPLVNAR